MKLLVERFELLPNYEEQCWWKFEDFLTERDCKDIAVFMFGNDLPYTVKMVRALTILGDGDCPQCGSSNRSDIDGGFCRNDYGQLCTHVLGYKCNNCGWEDLR